MLGDFNHRYYIYLRNGMGNSSRGRMAAEVNVRALRVVIVRNMEVMITLIYVPRVIACY